MNYHTLTQYGSFIPLDIKTDAEKLVSWSNQFDWVKYNPRKDVNRWGLSITSLDGGLSGIPDLDSLYEYNKENGTKYTEQDFSTPTPVLNEQIKTLLAPWEGHYYRTHFLKFGPGGFFPPHRDWDYETFTNKSFRLIIPLRNVNPPSFNFILEDKILHWEVGSLYFLDTIKVHYLFNGSFDDSYWIVVNVAVNQHTIKSTLENVKER